jgi:hypothetical protein
MTIVWLAYCVHICCVCRHATYFFEMEDVMADDEQVERLLAVLSVPGESLSQWELIHWEPHLHCHTDPPG